MYRQRSNTIFNVVAGLSIGLWGLAKADGLCTRSLILDPVVEDYGPIVQDAITTLAPLGGRLCIGAGTFPIKTSIVRPAFQSFASSLTISGTSRGGTILKFLPDTGVVIHLVSIANLLLQDFTIMGTGVGSEAIGLEIGEEYNVDHKENVSITVRIQNLNIRNLGAGVVLRDEMNVVRFDSNSFFDLNRGGIRLINQMHSVSNVMFDGNQFHGVRGHAVEANGGSGMTFIGNIVEGPVTASGFYLDGFDSATFQNNYFEFPRGSTGAAIELGATSIGGDKLSGATIQSNHIDLGPIPYPDNAGIKIANCQGIVMSSNNFNGKGLTRPIVLGKNVRGAMIGPNVYGTALLPTAVHITKDASVENILIIGE